ncbi:MAG: single-stranded-DNA-specific exonuclease RecJ [Granulosicoccaceae bacterium]
MAITPAPVIKRREVPELAERLHSSPLAHRLLAARGVVDKSDLDYSLANLPKPDTLLDIDTATQRLLLARQQQQRIVVVGDYDCDGATSTTLAILGLKALGYQHVSYFVPNRFEYGYGLSPAIVDALAGGEPQLIVTVDNGVASVEGVERASKLGIDVIVTDHHLPPTVLPRATAIINPSIPGSRFPSKNLAGVGVCFYVLLALRQVLDAAGLLDDKVNLAEFLDLVAIGTVADVVPLDSINRTLVEQGIRRIRRGVTRPGVLALLAKAGCAAETLSTMDIGFALGPRINAAGRLDDMTRGVETLMTTDKAQAVMFAQELDQLNQQRRSIERSMRSEAELQLAEEAMTDAQESDGFSVVLFNENWHQGVIGILAGRIKEAQHKPVVIFAADGEQVIKGSARSIPGVHIRDIFERIAARHPDRIEKFGGHAMAAGLTIERRYFAEFAEAFEQEVRIWLKDERPNREWLTDGELYQHEFDLQHALILENLAPWGQGFDAPVFDGEFCLISAAEVGTGHLKLQLKPLFSEADNDARPVNAIAFNQADDWQSGEIIKLVYRLGVNRYRGSQNLQLEVQHIQSV